MTVAIIAACTPTLGPLLHIYPSYSARRSPVVYTSDERDTAQRRLNAKNNSKGSHPLDGAYRSDLETGNGTTTRLSSTNDSQKSVQEFPEMKSGKPMQTTNIHLSTLGPDGFEHTENLNNEFESGKGHVQGNLPTARDQYERQAR